MELSDAEKFFESNKESIDNEIDEDSEKEKLAYFTPSPGNLDNLDNWLKHQEFRLKKANQDSERKLREKNAKLAFQFSSVWAIFIGAVIILKGFNKLFTHYVLTQAEFLFIIGSLTTSIFTFYLLVLKYLFYRKNDSKNHSS